MEENYIYVVYAPIADKTKAHKFKMMLKGDVGTLAVPKIKRYLAKATGVPESQQILRFRGRELLDSYTGSNFGLQNGDEMTLHVVEESQPPPTHPQPPPPFSVRNSSPPQQPSHPPPMPTPLPAPTPVYPAPVPPAPHVPAVPDPMLGQLQSTIVNLEKSNADLQHEVSDLRSQIVVLQRSLEKARNSVPPPTTQPLRGQALADKSLQELAVVLGVPANVMTFDANMTCSIQIRGCTVLVTYDSVTQRLYVYSTLLSALPRDAATKVRVYEMLLESALLGRDIAGGCVGISLRNDLVLLSTSVDLMHSDETALRDAAHQFVDCLLKWRQQLRQFLN
eukprot:PhF_6_TR29495/c0_g1_i1/m.43677